MGERITVSYKQRTDALRRIGEGIATVQERIAAHLLSKHDIHSDSEEYLDLFASHLVEESLVFPEQLDKPEAGIVYTSARRNRVLSRLKRAGAGGRRWSRDVTDF